MIAVGNVFVSVVHIIVQKIYLDYYLDHVIMVFLVKTKFFHMDDESDFYIYISYHKIIYLSLNKKIDIFLL